MWRLIGRSVDTYLLIAHWEFLISFDACLVIVFIWDMDMLIMMIDYLDWGFRLWRFFLCFIAIFVWDIDMLIMLIDHLTLLSIVTLILPCLFLLPHMYRLTIVYHLIWHDWFSRLYIIMIVVEHAIICQIFFSISLCVDLDDIYLFCMMFVAWLLSFCVIAWVTCLCGTHTYPLISKSLVLVDLVFWGLVWYEICCFVCSLTELVIRNRV